VSSAEYIVTGIKRHRVVAVIVLTALVLGGLGLAAYLRARTSEVAIESIAVLPFQNTSGDPNAEYLSEGIAESLINSLTQLQQLRVVARTTAFRYKGKDVDPQQAGRDLKVRAVLSGRVRQMGDTLNIQVDLMDVTTGAQLWGEEYERRVEDVVAVKQAIAREVTEKLRLRLSGEQQQQLARRDARNGEAYQLYLKGRFHWNKRNAKDFQKAIEYFNQAIERDPSYALAYSGLAETYVLLPVYSAASPQEGYPKAKAAAKKAIELDETLAEPHSALGYELMLYDWDLEGSEREFKRAIELNPNYATGHQWYGERLMVVGRFDETLAERKRAQELDPLSLIVNTNVALTYYYARQFDKAIDELRKVLEMDQTFYYARWNLGLCYQMKGMFSEAISEYQKAWQLSNDPAVLALIGQAYASSGRRDEALRVLAQLKEISKSQYVSAYSFALVHAALGDRDEAFRWLEKSYADHSFGEVGYIKIDPLVDSLRSDSRFTDLLRRLGLVT
jgi:TolB-like protein/Flp pilus assembly protein TadD